jgi:hypothetical protein
LQLLLPLSYWILYQLCHWSLYSCFHWIPRPTHCLCKPWILACPHTVQLFGEPILWVDAASYLGVILDTRLTWSPHIDQVRKKAAQRLGVLGPLLHRRSGLTIRNGVLLYKQLIRPMMDYGCPVWRLPVIQSKCLRAATGAPWYISNRQIHEDLGVPLFADHIRSLTESFDSKLAGSGNPLVRQLGRYLTEGWPKSPEAQAKGGDGWLRSPVKRPPSRPNESCPTVFS